jgi:hypothetical protein
MATLFKTDGTQTEVSPKNGRKFTLEELQGYVEGFIEVVRTHDGRLMVIDEEGKLKGKPYNRGATHLYECGSRDPIVGDAIIGTRKEMSG